MQMETLRPITAMKPAPQKANTCAWPRSKILVVDDDFASLMIIKRMLNGSYEIKTAGTGHDATKLLTTERFNLILMDIYLPGKSGIELTCEIRADKNNLNTNTPVLAMSATYKESIEKLCPQYGVFEEYLLKPIDDGILHAKIAQYVLPAHFE